MSYDAAGTLTKIVYPNGQFLAYTYSAGEHLTQIADQTGVTENFVYNDLGQLASVTDAKGNLIVSYSYDAAGLLAGEVHGNGTYTTYTHDRDENLTSVVNFAPDASVNSSFTYTYNALGLVTSMTTTSGTTNYGYDSDERLIAVALPTSETITYQYDAMGNRVVVSDNNATTTYASNALNQYTSVGSAIFSYDADGNLTMTTGGPGGSTVYTYDDMNRLIGVKTASDLWTYQYNALGFLVASTHNGQLTQYLIDLHGLGNVVAEYDGSGNVIANFTYGAGLVSEITAAGVANYYDFDASGNTAGLSGPAGTYVASYNYLPFGEVRVANGNVNNPFEFGGQLGIMTAANGLDFMRARFYSPSLGRFLNPDPSGLAGGMNLYAYTADSPITIQDPSGLVGWANNPNSYSHGGGLEPGTRGFGSGAVGAAEALFNFIVVSPAAAITTGVEAGSLGAIAGFAVLVVADVVVIISVPILIFDTIQMLNVPVTGPDPHPPAAPLSGAHTLKGPSDPNAIYGPGGDGPQGYVPIGQMPYAITFDNKPTANAPAQIVTVTEQLSANLDWTTFQLADFGLGGQVYVAPPGLTSYTTLIDATSTVGVYVQVDADFNPLTGLLNWTFTSIDPTTLDVPIGNVDEGFLPPDVTPPDGEAFIAYSVESKQTDTTGTVISAQGTVIFQAGLPGQSSLATPTIFNTIDVGAPTSSVTPLPDDEDSASFTLAWSGQDDVGGSGVASYDIYVSDNGGPFTALLRDTTQTSTTFSGQIGHDYAFYSVATDNVGNVQATPTAAQATTFVAPALIGIPASFVVDNGRSFSGIIAGFTDPNGARPTSNYSATINWGDGSAVGSSATIQAGGASNAFKVLGTHTYAKPGVFTVTVVVTSGTGPGVTVSSTANVLATVQSVQIDDGSAQRSMVRSLTVTFSGVVTLNGSKSFVLTNNTAHTTENLVVTSHVVNGDTIATLDFTGSDIIGSSLADGRYTLTIIGSQITGPGGLGLDAGSTGNAGSSGTNQFFRLFGDANGDGKVDNTDLIIFQSANGKHIGDGGYLSYMDFNGDGVIDLVTDYAQFRKRYGHSI